MTTFHKRHTVKIYVAWRNKFYPVSQYLFRWDCLLFS